MSPAAATAARQARRPVAQPGRRPPLEVVGRRRAVRRRRLAPALSAVLVAGSLLLVVAGHSELAQGQVRLASVQAAVTAAQTALRQEQLSVAKLEDPARIVREAEATLHMVAPGQVTQLPHVTLSTPLPAPAVTPTAVPPAAATATSPRP